MKSKYLILGLILSLLFLPMLSAVCTLTLDKTSYSPTETASAEMVCTANTEKSDPYTVNWTYENGTEVELDSATTPSTISQTFYETYAIPSTWPNGVFLNATLEGGDLDGATDSANISGATANSLLITAPVIGGGMVRINKFHKGSSKR
jgi:hypothetical protein